ncbi:MAG: hypothetical protein NTW19_06510 [Planctomycetota bacterium]|nr:hypothetical protein [Planctomycetota bacterium]
MESSGRIMLADGIVRCESTSCGGWQMAVPDLRLVGECTTPDGPMADDWFICFVIDGNGWREAPVYADGFEEFLETLGKALRHSLICELANSSSFNSRILWPAALSGRALFRYGNDSSDGWMRRAFLKRRTLRTFSDDAMQALIRQN